MSKPPGYPSEPKPIFWIRLPRNKPQKDPPVSLERFNGWSGRLELELEVVSDYLSVGSGNFELFNLRGKEQAYYAFARRNSQLVLPGTGIKGAVRSIVEAISNSCVKLSARGERVPISHQVCKDENSLCPACRLFGTTGYRGRVYFSDAVPVGQIKPTVIKIADLWPPRQAKGRKFYQAKTFQPLDMQPQKSHRFIEAVPKGKPKGKGRRFSATLYFENATTAEMGLLLRAMGLDRDQKNPVFPVKIGGAKPRCLGAVRLTPKQLYLIRAGSEFFSSLLEGGRRASLQEDLKAWLEDDSLLDQQAWGRFLQEAKPKVEPCPKELY